MNEGGFATYNKDDVSTWLPFLGYGLTFQARHAADTHV